MKQDIVDANAIGALAKFITRYKPEAIRKIISDFGFATMNNHEAGAKINRMVGKYPGFSPNDAAVLISIIRKKNLNNLDLFEYLEFLQSIDWSTAADVVRQMEAANGITDGIIPLVVQERPTPLPDSA